MKKVLFLLVAVVVLSACKYEKLLKSHDYKLKYNKALEYYEDEEYARAQGLFEQLRPLFKATRQADTVFFYNAYCSFYMKDYMLAGHYFEEFYKTFGNSKFAEEAEFMTAYSKFKLSPRYTLDQAYTYEAINGFLLYMTRHPNSERIGQCNELISEMRQKLSKKSFYNAQLYYKLGDYKAAIVALENVIVEYPNTEYREEVLYLIVKSNFLLADNSVLEKQQERYQATIDEYFTFINEFPESDYKGEVVKMYEDALSEMRN